MAENKGQGWGRGLWNLVPSALLLVANVVVFATFTVYHGNPTEFEVGFLDMLLRFLLLAGGSAFVLVLAGLLCPRRWRDRYAALLFALAVLTWVQGSFLVWQYGVFDGRGIDWQTYDWLGWVDLGLWTAVIAGSVILARTVLKNASLMASILLCLQCALLFGQGGSGEDFWTRTYVPEDKVPDGLLAYSSQKNVVHFILDSFQSDVFQELVESEGLKESFSGFTQFYENAGVAPHTPFAVPAVFSGKVFEGKQSPAQYFQDAVSNGFHRQLYDHGYTVNLIPQLSMREGKFSHYYEIPTAYRGGEDELILRNAALLLDIGIFRCVPHYVRKLVYAGGNWLVLPFVVGDRNVDSFQEKAFFSDYIDGLRVEGEQPAYHFIHLMPPHPPYVTLADGSYAGRVLPNTRENFVNEARAMVLLLARFVDRLKSLGLYDDALIIVQGDHGSQVKPVVNGEEVSPCLPRLAPLLAVKAPGSVGPMATSAAPTSLIDIAPTVLKLAEIDSRSLARTVFEIPSDQARTRPFMVYHGDGESPYVSTYSLTGSVYDSGSCRELGTVAVQMQRESYVLGSRVKFGMTGNSDSFLGPGWSSQFQLGEICWTDGNDARLEFPMEPPENDVVLSARLIPFIHSDVVPQQRIKVSANGSPIAEWVAVERKTQQFSAVIPKEVFNGSLLELAFELPDAAVPAQVGAGGDARKLGIAMLSIDLRDAKADPGRTRVQEETVSVLEKALSRGERLSFGSDGDGNRFLRDGWSSPSQAGICWNNEAQANISLPVVQTENDLQIEIELVPYLPSGFIAQQTVHLWANGQHLSEWRISKNELQSLQATVPGSLTGKGVLNLTFEFPDATSPESLGLSPDVRPLAAAIHALTLR